MSGGSSRPAASGETASAWFGADVIAADLADGRLFVADYDGIGVYDLSDPDQAVAVGLVLFNEGTVALRARGDRLVVASEHDAHVWAIGDPADAQWLGRHRGPGEAVLDLDLVGDVLLLSDRILTLEAVRSPCALGP